MENYALCLCPYLNVNVPGEYLNCQKNSSLIPCFLMLQPKTAFFFFQESGLSIDQSQKEPFVELNRILEALKVRVLRPALE